MKKIIPVKKPDSGMILGFGRRNNFPQDRYFLEIDIKKLFGMIYKSLKFKLLNRNHDSGIILGFDDYFPEAWEQCFDLFDRYNAKATFFVTGDSPTSFCLNAQARGHEIGYHTINHPDLKTVSKEEFFEQTVSRIGNFRKAGIELTAFAYPYGRFEKWMHEELLKYYKIVRGFYGLKFYSLNDIKSGFIESCPIDNSIHSSEAKFKRNITGILWLAKTFPNTVVSLSSHDIGDNWWSITPARMEYVLKKCRKFNLKFYRYKDLL